MDNIFIKLDVKGSDQGNLIAIEANNTIPFYIERVYYTFNVVKGAVRGHHAHKKIDQMIWCPYGQIEVMMDNGFEKKIFLLDSPEKAIIVYRGMWHEMKWLKEGSILCAVASEKYSESDYIRNYEDFIKYVEGGYWNESEL